MKHFKIVTLCAVVLASQAVANRQFLELAATNPIALKNCDVRNDLACALPSVGAGVLYYNDGRKFLDREGAEIICTKVSYSECPKPSELARSSKWWQDALVASRVPAESDSAIPLAAQLDARRRHLAQSVPASQRARVNLYAMLQTLRQSVGRAPHAAIVDVGAPLSLQPVQSNVDKTLLLRDLQSNRRTRGHLHLTVCSECIRSSYCAYIARDDAGDLIVLAVYNTPRIQSLLEPGSYTVVDPMVKTRHGLGYFIRLDCPAELRPVRSLAEPTVDRVQRMLQHRQYCSALSIVEARFAESTRDHAALAELAAIAAYELGHYDKAEQLARDLTSTRSRRLCSLIGHRQREQAGQFAWQDHVDVPHRAGVHLGDYVTSVSIEDVQYKGRGLVARRFYQAGDLIMVERPLAMCDGLMTSDILGAEVTTRQFLSAAQMELRAMLLHAMDNNILVRHKVARLFAGPDAERLPSDVSQRVHNTSLEDVAWSAWAQRVHRVCHYNTFKPFWSTVEPSAKGASALYYLASHINNDCTGNSLYFFARDSMVFRATREINIGEEITTAYMPHLPLAERQASLRVLGIDCQCDLCRSQAGMPVSQPVPRFDIANEHAQRALTLRKSDLDASEAETINALVALGTGLRAFCRDVYLEDLVTCLPRIAPELAISLCDNLADLQIQRGRHASQKTWENASSFIRMQYFGVAKAQNPSSDRERGYD
ncbi:uncharacterized protein L969DRAFT_47600 [Mixia osmundae IAM 14324]|uniref:SET domain-containing protein n=1 Tax=Mixia osmundae (strain CBS 9802 / IAM 14324 / JCM 22182 / KY 12970) TaxID=764103 RepID=G7E2T0_MIXOS|nr:uncharacterized protein L969DRAFT_47600 [Mixia osmundae IAM 14324]KEI40309.1 hypothetical protein L969DRAFT_47600 [Mixia osmundae IAM 14324]GAA97140.1 hypothetical protein E5Q_03815 [Mixia osmundae IAM 14324]